MTQSTETKFLLFFIESLADNPEIVDPYGSFLYVR